MDAGVKYGGELTAHLRQDLRPDLRPDLRHDLGVNNWSKMWWGVGGCLVDAGVKCDGFICLLVMCFCLCLCFVCLYE